jgi:hypothetical protein
MADEQPQRDEAAAEDLLRRALLDGEGVAVAMRVRGLPLSDEVTIVFHGRRDLSTIQTYVADGGCGAGSALGASELLRVPCDLDLGDAEDTEEARSLYAEQAGALHQAIVGADTVLSVWREPLSELADGEVMVERSVSLDVNLPAHRLMPTALVAPERQIRVLPVCGARTLAEGRPPLGIACAQQDVVRVYPLPEDPEHCLQDFLEAAADHARELARRLEKQEASVARFLELNGGEPAQSG